MFFSTESDLMGVLAFNIGVLLAFIAYGRLADADLASNRIAFGSIAASALLFYLAWRILDTMPPFEFTPASLWPYVYLSFETVSVVYAVASIIILFRRTDWTEKANKAEALMDATAEYPSVSVFICTYNEPLHILEKSVIGARSMDYPDFRVYVCDDTRRQEVRDYCAAVGVNYITRPDNQHAKAGNLNNALKNTNASDPTDLIMVLDADFAPQANFLNRVVGLFQDPRIGVVQTPQFYFNADPIQHNLGIQAAFVDDQRVFFDTFQPAKDAVDCAFCVGTSFVVRRSAVNELGGFPHEALSEDMLLSYRLMERGYVTRWLNERLSVGLSAEGIPEYITQRTRWCLGTIQIGLLKDGPLGRGSFSLRQRLHYIHGLLSWLSKPFILCLLFAPGIYWLFGLPALHADELLFMKYGISSLLIFWVYSSWISGRRTLPLFTEVTHAITALPVTITLFQAIRQPFGRPFKVTEKGGDRSRVRLHAPTAAFFGVVTALSAASISSTIFSWDAPNTYSGQQVLMLLWSAISMTIAFVSLLVCIELPRHGQEELIPYGLYGFLETESGARELAIRGLSTDTIEAPELDWREGEEAFLLITGIGRLKVLGPMPNGERGRFAIETSLEQRNAILSLLFRVAPEHIAGTGKLSRSMFGLLRRALAG